MNFRQAGAELCQAQGKLRLGAVILSLWKVLFERFGLASLVCQVWLGRLGLVGLVW